MDRSDGAKSVLFPSQVPKLQAALQHWGGETHWDVQKIHEIKILILNIIELSLGLYFIMLYLQGGIVFHIFLNETLEL